MTVFDLWKNYRQRVLPVDASEIQVTECRRAFYAGAWGVLNKLSSLMSAGDEITDADIKMVARFHEELLQFGAAGGE